MSVAIKMKNKSKRKNLISLTCVLNVLMFLKHSFALAVAILDLFYV